MKRLITLATTSILLLAGATCPAFAAPFAYIVNTSDATVSVLDTANNKVVANIPTQSTPFGIAIKPDGSRVYVANSGSNSVTVIDAQTNSVITHIPVGDHPYGVAMKPDGSRVYVTNFNGGTVSVVNTADNTVAATISLGGVGPHGVVVNPTGTRAYVTGQNTNQVLVIDTAADAVVGNPIPVGSQPTGIEVNPLGNRLFVVNQNSDNVTVVNLQTDPPSVIATVGVGKLPWAVAVKPDSSRVYVGNRIDYSVSVIDGFTNAVVGIIPVGGKPHGVAVNPAGNRLYTVNWDSNSVSVFNMTNNTFIRTISVGSQPLTLGRFIGPAPAPASTVRLSLSSSGSQGKDDSTLGKASADGRYVAFVSEASNLVGGDTNGVADVFVRDRITKQTRRVSVGPGGVQANGPSFDPAISADGRAVAFASDADNLVNGDTNLATDVFVRDLNKAGTTRVSVGAANPPKQANGDSYKPAINADGSKVAFTSEATNLAANDKNGVADVFVRDRKASTTDRASIKSGANGAEGNGESGQASLSESGRFVAFISRASNLVGGDTNKAFDVFLRDRKANTIKRMSISWDGEQANKDSWQPAVAGEGRYVVFASDATNLVSSDTNGVTDIFMRDTKINATGRQSIDFSGGQADGPSYNPVVSNDGRYVAFDSLATLDALDYNEAWDVYMLDRVTGKTSRLSVSTSTVEGNADSRRPAMSSDGRYVLFESFSNNLVRDDANNSWDIFVRDRGVGTTPTYPESSKIPRK